MRTFLFACASFVLAAHLSAAELPLAIDKAHSQVEAAVKATMDNFTAKLSAFDATITVDPAEKRASSAQIKFHFSDVKTGKDKRDVEMHHWQQTEQFPECTYVMTSLQLVSGNTYTARGKFTLHGVTNEITFPITVSFTSADTCKLDSEFPLNTQDYGLPVFKKFGLLKVDPLLKIRFHLEGRITPSS